MKILYLTYSPSPYRIDFFEELGLRVDLTVCFETTPEEDKTKRNQNWYNTTNKNFKSIYLKNHYFLNKRISFDFIKILKREKFDIIVISGYNNLTAILGMTYLKVKKIIFFINTDGGFKKDNESKIVKNIKKILISMGSYYLASGENAKKYLAYYGANKNNIYLYPFTTIKRKDLIKSKLAKDKLLIMRKKLKIQEKFIILSIGQFINRKGFDILLKACNKLSNEIGIYIIGDKPTEEYIELANNCNNNIHFIDYKPKVELVEYIKSADVFVFPTREDIYGLVVVEALSLGLPVITTKKCGAGLDLIKDGYNGFLVNTEDVNDLHEKMSYFINNKEKIKKMGINAIESVKDYTIENEVKTHLEIFDEIIKKENGKH